MRNINEIIIHCSATPEGREVTVKDITKWHIERGFKTIGYHYIIYLDGSVHIGRSEEEVGAHCLNHNSNSISICYVGGMNKVNKKPKDTRTDKQKEALIGLVKDLKIKYSSATIHGHNEFADKACPSFSVKDELNLYK